MYRDLAGCFEDVESVVVIFIVVVVVFLLVTN